MASKRDFITVWDWVQEVIALEKIKKIKRRASEYRERKQEIHTTNPSGEGKVSKLFRKGK